MTFPINNNADAGLAGGTHWSLLCYLRASPAHVAVAAQACVSTESHNTDIAPTDLTADGLTTAHCGGNADAACEASRLGAVQRGHRCSHADTEATHAAAFVHLDSCRGSNDAAVQRYLPAARQLVGARQPSRSAYTVMPQTGLQADLHRPLPMSATAVWTCTP